ncbi:MAG: hypothetical protein C0186_02515 [Thermodesulfovibrio aggregans]|uniref:Molybdopterin-guanine dinucleotide biosynthesis protein B (MobB) domain-containing protein n=1 Tax=Thermodesulfovibrio aggregans TaxID=86166 RepID=A0A2J6WNK2_9BACT|nr:MAG: hypothetical protein C0186_02515 [Thermodesulfovibrio aggregans]
MFFSLSIGVGGSKSGTGKTLFIESFIKILKKQFPTQINIIAVKYTKTSLYSSIIKEPSIIETEGKDTSRIKKAGADYVYLVKATENDLPEIAERLKKEFLDHIYQNDKKRVVFIIEGNSLVRIMQPDVIIFLKGQNDEHIKPSGKAILEIADIVIEGKYSMEEVMEEIETIQQRKLIEKLLKERSNSGKITCAEARKIAEEIGVPYIEVGRAANELNIKIRKCELGCF